MKELVSRIHEEIQVFQKESDSLIEKGVKSAGPRA